MVKPLSLVALAALFIIGCSGSDDQPEEINTSTSTQTDQTSGDVAPLSNEQPGVVESAPPAPEDSLYLRYSIGDTFKYRVKQSTTSRDDSVQASSTSTHEYTKKVTGIQPSGDYEFDLTFTAIKMGVSTKHAQTGVVGMQQSYDSKKKADREDPTQSQFSEVLGSPVKVVISKNTDIRDIQGVGGIVDNILKNAPNIDQASPQDLAMVRQQLEQQLTTTMFAAIAVQEFVRYPDDLLLKGNTWTKSQESPLGAMFILSSVTRYTITDIKVKNGQRIATVEAELNGDIRPHPQAAAQGVTIKLSDTKMFGTSKALLNLDNGVTISKKNKVISSVTAEVTQNATGQTQSLKQSQEQRIEVTLLP